MKISGREMQSHIYNDNVHFDEGTRIPYVESTRFFGTPSVRDTLQGCHCRGA